MGKVEEDVLKEIGWKVGLAVPVANRENSFLQSVLEALVLRRYRGSCKHAEVIDSTKSVEKSFKDLIKQHKENNEILGMCIRQTEVEAQKLKLKLSEKEHIIGYTNKIKKTIKDINERLKMKRSTLAERIERLQNIKAEIYWDEEALKAWEENLNEKNTDMEILNKFTEEDRHALLDMRAKRQRLRAEFNTTKELMLKQFNDCLNYERYADRAQQIFKRLQEERLQLLKHWNQAVGNLRHLDESTKMTRKNIEQVIKDIEQGKVQIQEENEFLEREKINNHETDLEMAELHVLGSRIRREIIYVSGFVLERWGKTNPLVLEVERDMHYLRKLYGDYKELKVRIKDTKEDIKASEKAIIKCTKTCEKLKESVYTKGEYTQSLNDELDFMILWHHELEMHLNRLEAKIAINETKLGKVKNVFRYWDNEEVAQISCVEKAKYHLRNFVKSTLDDKKRNSSIGARLAFVEVRLSNKGWIRRNRERSFKAYKLIVKLETLEENIITFTEYHKYLADEVYNMKNETKQHLLDFASAKEEASSIKAEIKTLKAINTKCTKEATIYVARDKRKQLEEMILKLKVHRKRKGIDLEKSKIYKGQKKAVWVLKLLKRLKLDYRIAQDMYHVKKRSLEEERLTLKNNILFRNNRIEYLKSKLDSVTISLGKDAEGKPFPLHYYQAKSLLDKRMMNIQIKELTQKIKTAEAEVVAAENTLKLVSSNTLCYGHSLSPVKLTDVEEIKMQDLKNAFKNKTVLLRDTKLDDEAKDLFLKEMTQKLATVLHRRDKLQRKVGRRKRNFDRLCQGLESKEEKILRSDKQIRQMKKRIPKVELFRWDTEIQTEQYHDANMKTVRQLSQFANENWQFTDLIFDQLKEAKAKLPQLTTLKSSSSLLYRLPQDSSESSESETSTSITMCNVSTIHLRFADKVEEFGGPSN